MLMAINMFFTLSFWSSILVVCHTKRRLTTYKKPQTKNKKLPVN